MEIRKRHEYLLKFCKRNFPEKYFARMINCKGLTISPILKKDLKNTRRKEFLANCYSLIFNRILSKEEEFKLFKKFNFYKWMIIRLLNNKHYSIANRIKQAEPYFELLLKVREIIVECNNRLIAGILRNYLGKNKVNLEERSLIISDLVEKLLMAIDYFDYTRGLKFSTYAVWCLKHALIERYAKKRRSVLKTNLPDFCFESIKDREIHSESEFDNMLKTISCPRRRKVVDGVFRLGKQLHEIAAEENISKERVRQLKLDGLEAIKEVYTDVF